MYIFLKSEPIYAVKIELEVEASALPEKKIREKKCDLEGNR